MRPIRGNLLRLAAILGAIGTVHALRADPPDGDDDDRVVTRVLAERAIRENCLICHDADLITSQRLTSKQWKAEVEKMVGWGAPLPSESQPAVIDHLAATYPATQSKPRPPVATLAAVSAPIQPIPDQLAGSPENGKALYARNCANCHGDDGQGSDLGPNLLEKPSLYRRPEFGAIIRQGRGRMPEFGSVIASAGDDDMLLWLRSRVFQPRRPTSK